MESLPAKSPVAPRSRRRWFSFSLRVLFVVIAVVAIFPGRALYKAERQRQAVAHVLSLGGKVTYEHQMVKDKGYVPDAPAPGPSWLVDFFGVDFVARVHGVDIGTWSTKDVISNSDLGRLEELNQAKSVGIRYSKWITDDGLRGRSPDLGTLRN
jgi:hypothetical protein